MTDDEMPSQPAPPAQPYSPPPIQAALHRFVAKTLGPLPRPVRIVMVILIITALVVLPVVLLLWSVS